MQHQVIIDTGVLIALIDRQDHRHTWVVEQLKQIAPPLLTCEAVISESWFLLQRVSNGQPALLQLLTQQQIIIKFNLEIEILEVLDLLVRYQSVPASLADSELVRMTELLPNSSVFTLDSDFLIYRKNRNQLIPLIFPT